MATQHVERNLLLNLYKENISLVCFFLPLNRDKNVWHLQPPFSTWRPLAFLPVTLSASLTRWTWVWVNSGSWWWTGRPGMLWFMGSQRVRQDWVTELNWRDLSQNIRISCVCACVCLCVCIGAQLCLILCGPMDYKLPGSNAHGIYQAAILEWGAISYSRGSFWPR